MEERNQIISNQIITQNLSLLLEGNISGPGIVVLNVMDVKRRRPDLEHNTLISTAQAQVIDRETQEVYSTE